MKVCRSLTAWIDSIKLWNFLEIMFASDALRDIHRCEQQLLELYVRWKWCVFYPDLNTFSEQLLTLWVFREFSTICVTFNFVLAESVYVQKFVFSLLQLIESLSLSRSLCLFRRWRTADCSSCCVNLEQSTNVQSELSSSLSSSSSCIDQNQIPYRYPLPLQ